MKKYFIIIVSLISIAISISSIVITTNSNNKLEQAQEKLQETKLHLQKRQCTFIDGEDVCINETSKLDWRVCNIEQPKEQRFLYKDINFDNLRIIKRSISGNEFLAAEFNSVSGINDGPEYLCMSVKDYLDY